MGRYLDKSNDGNISSYNPRCPTKLFDARCPPAHTRNAFNTLPTVMPSNQAPATQPALQDFKEFTAITEYWKKDEQGELKFYHSSFLYVDQNEHTAWYGSLLNIRKNAATLEQATGCLRRIPNHEVYPPSSSDSDIPIISASGFNLASDTWIKRPMLINYDLLADYTRIADELLKEISIHRQVKQNPHPNLVQFKGCLQKGSLVVGILLQHYPTTFTMHVHECDQASFDKESCLEGITAGVGHLHSLGTSHNDLNPYNNMVDGEGPPVVIDFGSAQRLSKELTPMGTPDWNDGFTRESSKANDEIGLRKIREWKFRRFETIKPGALEGPDFPLKTDTDGTSQSTLETCLEKKDFDKIDPARSPKSQYSLEKDVHKKRDRLKRGALRWRATRALAPKRSVRERIEKRTIVKRRPTPT